MDILEPKELSDFELDLKPGDERDLDADADILHKDPEMDAVADIMVEFNKVKREEEIREISSKLVFATCTGVSVAEKELEKCGALKEETRRGLLKGLSLLTGFDCINVPNDVRGHVLLTMSEVERVLSTRRKTQHFILKQSRRVA